MSIPSITGWMLALASLMFAGAARGACDVPPPVRLAPPLVGGKPVEVKAGFTLIDLIAIRDADQTFTADVVFTLDWHDARLAAAARGESMEGCRVGVDDIWHPDVGAINRRALTAVYGPRVSISSEGGVHYEVRAIGDFSTRLDLRNFPFDTQALRIRIASFRHGPDVLALVGNASTRADATDFAIAGWSTLRSFVDAGMAPEKVGARSFSRLDYVLEVRRNGRYYVWNFVVPLVFIVLMAWTVFWLDPQAAGVQIGISTASAFTLVAFLVSLRGRLPPVPYLTRMDELILFSTMLVFAALAQAVLTSRLAQIEKIALARRLDAYGRWIYIAAFGLVLYMALAH